jgi:hypothetical protein
MLIRDKAHKHPPFDVAAGQVEFYLASPVGYEKYVDIAALTKAVQPVKWNACVGRIHGDYQYPPYILAYCPECGSKTAYTERVADEASLRHCLGTVEGVPAKVLKQFQELAKKYNARRQDKRQPDAITKPNYAAEEKTANERRQLLAQEQLKTARQHRLGA